MWVATAAGDDLLDDDGLETLGAQPFDKFLGKRFVSEGAGPNLEQPAVPYEVRLEAGRPQSRRARIGVFTGGVRADLHFV